MSNAQLKFAACYAHCRGMDASELQWFMVTRWEMGRDDMLASP